MHRSTGGRSKNKIVKITKEKERGRHGVSVFRGAFPFRGKRGGRPPSRTGVMRSVSLCGVRGFPRKKRKKDGLLSKHVLNKGGERNATP